MLVVLIGYRGTGKTTVARLLAERLELDWVDADEELQRRAQMSIKEIFDLEGESSFRDRESEVVSDLARRQQVVVAAGGGAILRSANRAAIRHGIVVWLKASPAVLRERIESDPATNVQRPDLTVGGGLQEIAELLSSREPIYRECADLQIDTERRSPQSIADEIANHIKRNGPGAD